MPSPFPGMDPYLENPKSWPDLHQRLISYSAEWLQPQLRPKYIARIGERVELASLGQAYIPDVLVIRSAPAVYATAPVGAAPVADEPLVMTLLEEERTVPFLEIIHHPSGEVVTLIEVLSPANKTGKGRESYLRKQEDICHAGVSLVEIDLLSQGEATTRARLAGDPQSAQWRYHICVTRIRPTPRIEVYPATLQQRLPRCRIPLRPEDKDAVLDLPAVFTRCYDIGGYDLLVDYSQPPPVPLSPADKEWMAQLLQETRQEQAQE